VERREVVAVSAAVTASACIKVLHQTGHVVFGNDVIFLQFNKFKPIHGGLTAIPPELPVLLEFVLQEQECLQMKRKALRL